jgi:hypothetical protein
MVHSFSQQYFVVKFFDYIK